MASFLYYDLGFLILFSLFITFFLYRHRKKLQIEAKILFLFRTKIGLDAINRIGKKHRGLFDFLSRFVIIAGYVMMAVAVFALFWFVNYMSKQIIMLKIPPLLPLVPYIDKVLPTGLIPPFYFTYWIIVIAIVAFFHEFGHGIFARIRNIKIKASGFGFLGPLPLAFVELDEKKMAKKPIGNQLAVLAAGSTANLVLWIIFLIITASFFSLTFMPSGVHFSSYMMEKVNLSEITLIEDFELSRNLENFKEFSSIAQKINKSEIGVQAYNRSYFANLESIILQQKIIDKSNSEVNSVVLSTDSPAYRANLSGAIQRITSKEKSIEITDSDSLQRALFNFKPGEEVLVSTTKGNYTLTLIAHPENEEKAFLGIAFNQAGGGSIGKIITIFRYKDPFVYYKPIGNSTNGSIIVFIYHLLYWITIVNFFVMFFNMLPVGMVDGGRFFYLTVLAMTRSKKYAFIGYKISTWMVIFAFLMMMGVWFIKAF